MPCSFNKQKFIFIFFLTFRSSFQFCYVLTHSFGGTPGIVVILYNFLFHFCCSGCMKSASYSFLMAHQTRKHKLTHKEPQNIKMINDVSIICLPFLYFFPHIFWNIKWKTTYNDTIFWLTTANLIIFRIFCSFLFYFVFGFVFSFKNKNKQFSGFEQCENETLAENS